MTNDRHLFSKLWLVVGLLLLAIGLMACAPSEGNADTPADEPAGETPVETPVYVDSVEILLMESFPLQARAVVRGNLPDGCTTLESTTVSREGDTFVINLQAQRDPLALCTQALQPFEQNVALDILGLPAGTYTVQAGEANTTFTLDIDNQ